MIRLQIETEEGLADYTLNDQCIFFWNNILESKVLAVNVCFEKEDKK